MSVYLVLCRDLGLCKIGYAKRPTDRVATLQTSAPGKLEIVATRDGSRLLEGEIHRAAKSFHRHGEWYHFSKEIESIFWSSKEPAGKLIKPSNRKEAKAKGLLAYLVENKLSASAFAEMVGTTRQNVSRWLNGTRPRDHEIVSIFEATGGKVGVLHFHSPEVLRTVNTTNFEAAQ